MAAFKPFPLMALATSKVFLKWTLISVAEALTAKENVRLALWEQFTLGRISWFSAVSLDHLVYEFMVLLLNLLMILCAKLNIKQMT
jgi:hypothetical protein